MITHDDYINWFDSIPDEHCYITNIYYNNLQNEIITTSGTANATTFTNWSDLEYKYRCNSGLKNYDSIDNEELVYLLQSPSLFGRKFTKKCIENLSITEYLETIMSY
jgi:hypothetical protein